MDLPTFIPIFPLPNVVLFPEVPLPLYIFEPRYREMVRDALAGSRLIGMVLLRDHWERDYAGAPEIYRIGCVGRIVEATPLADGKFNIVLTGLREFEVASEQRERSYRQATVTWRDPPPSAALPPDLRDEILRAVERYVGPSGRALTEELARDRKHFDWMIVNFFAFWLDFSPIEKQCLLEATGEQRARRLLEVLDFHLYATRGGHGEAGTRRIH
jgi:uncharacterized protein